MKKILAITLLCVTLVSVCSCKKDDTLGLTPVPTATVEPTPFEEVQQEALDATNTPEATSTPEAVPTQTAKSEPKAMYVKGTSVNVRQEPSTSGNKITELAQNNQVNVITEENGWSYVQYGQDKFGYMKSEYLSNQPVATAAPTPQVSTFDGREQKKYNHNYTLNDNVFLDALEYTGYNLKKHREDGRMWQFILGKNKEAMGYLSGLGYDYGNTSGYETNASGFPDIDRIAKKGGFVCASYVTYVYFNYLPNVAGIDTSMLTKPASSVSAQSWRLAAEDWVNKGLSRKIPFTASRRADGIIDFSVDEEIPIGSIVIFKMADVPDTANARHVAIYAGKAGGYYWMTHVGNERGPEMVTMERMGFSSTAELPLEIISTPIKFN